DYDFNMLDIAKDFEHPERHKIKELMPLLGKEVKRMHKANIVHNDLHAGNILVKNYAPGKWKYYKEKVCEARQKRRKFVKTKNKIREILGIK
ncbi:MAG: lipopolysaccharide kinase InaA family protein, partial [Halanaerobium sp.]